MCVVVVSWLHLHVINIFVFYFYSRNINSLSVMMYGNWAKKARSDLIFIFLKCRWQINFGWSSCFALNFHSHETKSRRIQNGLSTQTQTLNQLRNDDATMFAPWIMMNFKLNHCDKLLCFAIVRDVDAIEAFRKCRFGIAHTNVTCTWQTVPVHLPIRMFVVTFFCFASTQWIRHERVCVYALCIRFELQFVRVCDLADADCVLTPKWATKTNKNNVKLEFTSDDRCVSSLFRREYYSCKTSFVAWCSMLLYSLWIFSSLMCIASFTVLRSHQSEQSSPNI